MSSEQQSRDDKRRLTHSVSIIVEPVLETDDDDSDESKPSVSSERRNTIAGPILDADAFSAFEQTNQKDNDEIVKSIIAHARLRKEEFARLLEEHAQLVNEINRAETSLL